MANTNQQPVVSSTPPAVIGVLIVVFGISGAFLAISLHKQRDLTEAAKMEAAAWKTRVDNACVAARIRAATMLYGLRSPDSEPSSSGAAGELASWMTLCPDQVSRSKAITDALTLPRHDLNIVGQAMLEFSRGQ